MLSKFARLKFQTESSQYIFDLHPDTRLTIDQVAFLCGKTISTFRCDVSRRPESLPKLTRPPESGRVFVRVEDLLKFLNSPVDPHHQANQKRKAGRPANAKRGE